MSNIFAELRRHETYRLGAICTLVVCLAVPAQAASAPIPDFAPDPNTSWYPDREDGDN